MNDVGTVLFNARKAKSLTLKDVSSKTKIDFTLISKIEKGERNPTVQQLESLANLYNLSLKDLIISSYSDKVYEQIKQFDFAPTILKVAEEKVNYNRTTYV